MSGNTLWLVSIETRHGTDNSAHITQAGAERAVQRYVAYWWDEEMQAEHGDEAPPMPEDPDEAVTLYFEELDDEYYSIEQIPVLP